MYRVSWFTDSAVKNLPVMWESQELQVQCLGQEDTPEEGKTTHSSILVWWILWTDEYIGVQRVKHDWNDLLQHTHTEWWKYFDLVDFGEGSWRPQFSPDYPFRTAALDELNSTHLFETNCSIWRFMNWKGTEAVGYGQKGILLKCSCRQLVRPRRYLPVCTEL